MKFIVGAHLPYRLKTWLNQTGFDAIHTGDLPQANETQDLDIARIADAENRIVVSKDSDLLKLRVLKNTPKQFLMITTGNIVN